MTALRDVEAEASSRGALLIEMLVALVCAGLLSSAVLALVVNAARTSRTRQDHLVAQARVRAAMHAITGALRAAGGGVEGATAISIDGNRVPIADLEAVTARVVVPLGAARETESEPGGWLLVADRRGLSVGDRVVGLGYASDAEEVLPSGVVSAIERVSTAGRSGGRIRVAWAPPEAARVEREGAPRAILPVVVREIATRSGPAGLELRRRDAAGRWQPIVEGLEAVEVRPVEPYGGGHASGLAFDVRVAVVSPDGRRVTSRARISVR